MKKFIITTLAAFFGLAMMASSANAQAVFNSPAAMPTVTVSTGTCQQVQINGCWKPRAIADADGTIGVHVFYQNTGNVAAQGVTVSMSPQSQGPTTSADFSGSVKALNASTVSGTAYVSITSSQTVTFVDAKWYPGANSSGSAVDSSALFGSGFNVGTVNPGEYGKLVARFKVSKTVINQTYQCSDNTDNDRDGKTDYPSDPGCDSSTDNDESNIISGPDCSIDSFYSSSSTVASGGYPTLYWNTTNCDYVTIDWVSYPVDGSNVFGPLYSGKNYELRATRSALTQTRNLYVGVGQIQPTTYQCSDNIDNDNDGRTDYPNDTGCYSYTDNDEYNQVINNQGPQAITTVATSVGQTTAQLNGLAVPNSTYATTAWFEWGTTASFGSRTPAQSVTTNTSTSISSGVYGLNPGTVYWYRTVVQNQNGTAYGQPERFVARTNGTNPPVKVITKIVTVKSDSVTAQSEASLLELRVQNTYDKMCIGGEMNYTVTYRNISGQTLQNAVLRITHPKELTFISSSRGDYEVVDRTVTIPLGNVGPGEQGTILVNAKVNSQAVIGNLAVTTATVVYTNTISKAQEDAIAYSIITVSNDCPTTNNLGANAFLGGFFPTSILGWLLLILVILALIVLGRQLYKKKE